MDRSKLWPVLTVPLCPYIQPGHNRPIPTTRLRPMDSLNLQYLVDQLSTSIISTHCINDKPWSVISVFSPYSQDIHVMLMETSVDRYLPAPEKISDQDGAQIMQLWCNIISFIKRRSRTDRIFVGYNWSPRSWGEEEEKDGYQSIPTKWHPMLWSWPEFPLPEERSDSISWITDKELSPGMRRILCDNKYGETFAHIIKSRILPIIGSNDVASFKKVNIDATGVSIAYELNINELLSCEGFFPKLLKPIALALNDLMVEITQSFTDMDCAKIDLLLEKTVSTPLTAEEMQFLRATPKVKSMDQIFSNLKVFNLPVELLKVLFNPIESRCKQQGAPVDHWRKGFGYAFVISGNCSDNGVCQIKIMPGIYMGQGGVVEAKGVVLRRPENQILPDEKIMLKSHELHALKTHLESVQAD